MCREILDLKRPKTPAYVARENGQVINYTVDISRWGSVALLRGVLWISLLCSCSISEQFSVISPSYPLRNSLNSELFFINEDCHGESMPAKMHGQSFVIDGRWTYFQRSFVHVLRDTVTKFQRISPVFDGKVLAILVQCQFVVFSLEIIAKAAWKRKL